MESYELLPIKILTFLSYYFAFDGEIIIFVHNIKQIDTQHPIGGL